MQPPAHSNRSLIIFDTKLDTTLSRPRSSLRVPDIENVRYTAHESNGAGSWYEISNVAVCVLDLRMPLLLSCALECFLNFFSREGIADEGIGRGNHGFGCLAE